MMNLVLTNKASLSSHESRLVWQNGHFGMLFIKRFFCAFVKCLCPLMGVYEGFGFHANYPLFLDFNWASSVRKREDTMALRLIAT